MMSNKSLLPSCKQTVGSEFEWSIMITLTVSDGIPHASKTSLIFSRWMKSKVLEKSMDRSTAGRFLVLATSMTYLKVRI